MKNYLTHTLYLLGLVLLFLTLLSLFDSTEIAGIEIKRVSLLSDIAPDKPHPIVRPMPFDSVAQNSLVVTTDVNSSDCPKGMTCLEDYSKDKNGLKYFLDALKSVKKKSVYVGFFGDSFIEGDILSGSFRDTLQELYGGRGVGYLPIASEVAQFRTTIQHKYEAWDTYSMIGKKSDSIVLGFPGYAFLPQEGNTVTYEVPKRGNRKLENVFVYYQATQATHLHFTINDTLELEKEVPIADSIGMLVFDEPDIKSLSFSFDLAPGLQLFGASSEASTGVYVDNLAMRGNSGMGLAQIKDEQIKQFTELRPYRLLLLQYGLNVVTEKDSTGYAWYIEKMVRIVKRLKLLMPRTSIVIVSVSDRSYNSNGDFLTIPAIPVMRDAQREIARKSEVMFWDLYTAMGGENSMPDFVQAKPPLAAKDYTHLTYRGGKKLAQLMAHALLFEKERYEKK